MGCTSSQPAAAAAPPPPPVPEEFVAEMQQKVKQTVRRSSMWENDDDDAADDLARLCNEIKVDQRPDEGGGSDTASGTEPRRSAGVGGSGMGAAGDWWRDCSGVTRRLR